MSDEKRLIDANALLDAVDASQHDNPHTDSLVRATHKHEHNHFMVMIMQAPTVDAVEVVHGQWKVSRESEISRNVWCTACGKDFYMHRKGELQIDKMPYCPNCGAKMDGDGNA